MSKEKSLNKTIHKININLRRGTRKYKQRKTAKVNIPETELAERVKECPQCHNTLIGFDGFRYGDKILCHTCYDLNMDSMRADAIRDLKTERQEKQDNSND